VEEAQSLKKFRLKQFWEIAEVLRMLILGDPGQFQHDLLQPVMPLSIGADRQPGRSFLLSISIIHVADRSNLFSKRLNPA
jgi:hypothetical protein